MSLPPLPILARGEHFVVAGKPPRLLVHRTTLSTDRVVMLQWLRDQLGTRVAAIHRIDRPASGCVLFGTDEEHRRDLHDALASDTTEKVYLAVVRGQMPVGETRTLDGDIDGKEARTDVTVLASQPEPRCALVRCRIHTGRFHQVRRHLARIGRPILGDSQHGDTRVNRQWREEQGLSRLALHGWQLAFDLPSGRVHARCPLWPDLTRVLQAQPLWEQAVAREPHLARGWDTPPPWPGRDPRTHTPADDEGPAGTDPG